MARLGRDTYHRSVVGGSGAEVGRLTAIVLFTDLVGSTELRARLGEDAAEALRRRHDALVAGAIEAKRGRLVKNLGDGLMATFSGASDAVAAAVGIQQAIDRHGRSSPDRLVVRIGISAGDVAFEEEDCFGTPVIEAARLCAAAGGGQILVSEVVRLLAGSVGGQEFTPAGTFELKGLTAPLPACEVTWEPLPAALPLPSLLTGVGRIFVGREDETQRLRQLWKEAAGGQRRVVLPAGEPGIGKTRLAVQLAASVHEQGGLVLAGRCDEDMGVPYQPFVEALRHYAAHATEPRTGRHGGELVRLLPELAQAVPGLPPPLRSDPETERYRLFDAVAAWLADICAEAPVLLVLDDLHWAAKPTLLLLRHVVTFHEPLRLLVLGTYRDSEVGRGHPLSELLADLRRVEGVERFPLTGLDQAGVAAFIEAAAGHALGEEDEALPRAVWAETEGNPFFVAEVLRHLTETGAVEHREGRWITTAPIEDLAIPEGVRDVVGRRLSRLSEAANRALGVASVAGLEFEPGVVRAAGEFEEDALLRALEEATGARLVSEIPGAPVRYRFFHALVRATLYDELSAARRVAFHRKVAEAIETVHAGALDHHLSALAHHWARAAAPVAETVRAVDYARRAGDRALAQLANDEAVGYYRQALELLEASDRGPHEARRLELLIVLGEAQRRAGDPAFRDTLLEAAHLAQERGDTAGLTQAVLANSRGMMQSATTHIDRERVAALEAAISAGPVADSPDRARLLGTLGLELTSSGERQRRIALSDEALAMARRLEDDATLAHVLTARFYTLASPDTLAARLADTAEFVAIAERLGDPMRVAYAHFVRARARTEHGDVEAARADLEVAEGMAADLGQPTLRWYTAWGRAAHLAVSGHLEEAEAVAREAGRLAEATSQPDGPTYLAAQLFGIRAEQDRLAEVESVWVEVIERFPEAMFPRAILALLLSELGKNQEAKALLEDLDFLAVPVNNLWLWIMTNLSVVAARLRDVERCRALHQLIAPYRDQIAGIGPLWLGSVSHFLGLLATTLGSFGEAEGYFSAAAATHERISAPTWLARTWLAWAGMLLARKGPGDAQRARDLLGQALATARELGLANVERRAVELLNRR